MFKPMLAAPFEKKLAQWPMYASPKLDGVRACIREGRLMTRSLKPIPNMFVQNAWSRPDLDGLDGEFIFGAANSPDAFRVTQSALSNIQGNPLVFFHVFDYIDPTMKFSERLAKIHEIVQRTGTPYLQVVPQCLVNNEKDLDAIEEQVVAQGFEGVMLRTVDSGYKFGRSTASQGWLLKLKRFQDAEAIILDMEERMHNQNTQIVNALGYAERSSHQENLVGAGVLGALRVKDTVTNVEFNIGTGFTALQAEDFWRRKTELIGETVKYKFQPAGVKDKPRFPVFLGFRNFM